MIPTGVILSCKACGRVWIQTIGYALSDPTGPVTCPSCNTPYSSYVATTTHETDHATTDTPDHETPDPDYQI